jgi:flagellar basal body rod protein FlgG
MSSAKNALRYWERRQEVVANNLANVSTDGFKGERVFARMLSDNSPSPETATDLRSGSLRNTSNPLDIGLMGDGFLVVQTPTGERLSRGGAMRLDTQNFLVDQNGNQVLGEHGPIQIPAEVGSVEIDRGGVIRSAPGADKMGRYDGERRVLGTLRMESTPAGAPLTHEGNSYFLPPTGRAPLASAKRDVRQGFVEDSNVAATDAIVEMITIQRHFALAQKAITTLDESRGKAVNDLGRPV